MNQGLSWEANQFLASQEIPCILWNPNVPCRIHKRPPPVPILSQINPFHASPSTSWRWILILSPSTPGSPKWSLSLRFPHQNPVYASAVSHTCYMPHPPNYSRFYHPNVTGRAVHIIKQYRSLSSSLCLTKIQASWDFVCPAPEVTWRTVSITIRVILLSPYVCTRGVSLSSNHYNRSRRVYMYVNWRHQYSCLIWS
jgi:hypothetical protein